MAIQPRDKLSEMYRRHAAHYLEVLSGCHNLYLQGETDLAQALATLDLEWINIEAGQKWAVSRSQDDEEAQCL